MKDRLKSARTAQGSSAVEMLLVMPVALFFLFVVTDAGLTYVEKGMIADALRTGMAAEEVFTKGDTLFQLNGDYSLELNEPLVRRLVDHLAQEIYARVESGRGKLQRAEAPYFAVRVSALLFCITPQQGTTCDGRPYTSVAAAALGQHVEDSSFLTEEQFVAQELGQEQSGAVSRFALPMGIVYHADDPQLTGLRYQDRTLVLYAEVRARPSGINRYYSQRVLGHFFAVQEQQLHLVRRQYK